MLECVWWKGSGLYLLAEECRGLVSLVTDLVLDLCELAETERALIAFCWL